MKPQRFNHEVIGITEDDEIYTLESIHERGASGSGFALYSREWCRSQDVEDYFEYIDDCVGNDVSDEEKQCMTERLMEEVEFPGQDCSYAMHWKRIMKDADIDPSEFTLSCNMSGGIFDVNMKWKKIINPKLWKKIVQSQTQNKTLGLIVPQSKVD